MRKITYYLIIAIGWFIIVNGCKTNPFNNKADDQNNSFTDQKRTYLVKTIYFDPEKIFTVEEVANDPYWFMEYPLEIEFENYRPDVPINRLTGRVKLSTLGWTKIDTNHTATNSFKVRTIGKLGPVESIDFGSLDITEQNMKGLYYNAGPELDYYGINFTAVRK